MRATNLLWALAWALMAAGCVTYGETNRYPYDTSFEMSEPVAAYAALGQRTCLAEALSANVTAQCPLEATNASHPAAGMLIMDAFYTTTFGHREPVLVVSRAANENPTDPGSQDLDTTVWDNTRGMNPARASNGALPDLILPGPGYLVAVLGWWNNLDLDGYIEAHQDPGFDDDGFSKWNVSNEFIPRLGAVPLGYVEPGSRPNVFTFDRADANEPDFVLEYVSWGFLYASGGTAQWVVFTDGSLLQRVETTVVSNATVAPDVGGRTPFHPGGDARIDLDSYVGVAPTPVQNLYRDTLASAVNGVGSPNWGSCPSGCEIEAFPSTGLPIDDVTADTGRALWSRYPQEWRDGSGSTNAGRRADYLASYTPWIDLLPRSQTLYPVTFQPVRGSVPLIGGERDGEPTMAPGLLTFELRIGLHKDLNEDGYIGTASQPDPYEFGRRPHPDDYERTYGEFIGRGATLPHADPLDEVFTVRIRLVPDTDWGAGVMRAATYHILNSIRGSDEDERCWETTRTLECADPARAVTTGSTPIEIDVTWTSMMPGWYLTSESVFMPHGSPGFTACTEPLVLHLTSGTDAGARVPIRDCDHIAPYGGPFG